MNRRQFVGVGASAMAGGCLGSQSFGAPQTDTSTAVSSDTDSCKSERKRIDQFWTVTSGPIGGFTLSSTPRSLQRGDSLTVNLTNVTEKEQTSGNKSKYDIQYKHGEGWHSIFWKDRYETWTSEAIIHDPDSGFEWNLQTDKKGLTKSRRGGPDYYVCEELPFGKYRFVYWGIPSEEDQDTDLALSRQFSLEKDSA